MLEAAALLSDAGVDVLVWGGTAGSWLGLKHDRQLVDILQTSMDIPATTTTLAMLDACRVFGIERVSLVTPYIEEVVNEISACYRTEGVEVIAERHLSLSRNHTFGDVGGAELVNLIERAQAAGADGTLIVCTNLRVTSLVANLEAAIKSIIFDSIGVTLWGAMRLAGASIHLKGFGTLMAQGSLRSDLQTICQSLLKRTAADRVTVRADIAQLGISVNGAIAEAVRTGVRRIAQDFSIDQRSLNTIKWLEELRIPLIQNRFDAEPYPPTALLEIYGVEAQMLSPLELHGNLIGWLSVHSLSERPWSENDRSALKDATEKVLSHICSIT